MDSIATAEELLFSFQKQRISGNVLKVDFSKVFDMVD